MGVRAETFACPGAGYEGAPPCSASVVRASNSQKRCAGCAKLKACASRRSWGESRKSALNAHSARYRLENAETIRDRKLRTRYGIAISDYDAMLAAQSGHCAICPATEPGGRAKFFHVDHDHVTGKVRGLLCSDCNLTLGKMKDSPTLLEAAASYLRGRA